MAAARTLPGTARLALAGWFSLHLLACSAGSPPTIRYFDEVTAATITATAQPTVFARERPEFATHARDYVTISALAINRGGQIEYVLLVHRWSTVDPRLQAQGAGDDTDLLLVVDDRVLRLAADRRTLEETGTSIDLHSPPHALAPPLLYRTDPAMLRALGSCRTLEVLAQRGDPGGRFVLWRDARTSFGQLAHSS